MSRFSDLRQDLLSDHVHQLADSMRKLQRHALHLARLVHEAYPEVVDRKGQGHVVCNLCGLRLDHHLHIMGDYVTCAGIIVRLS